MAIESIRPPRKPARTKGLGVLGGMGIAALLHLAALGAAALAQAPEVLFGIGIIQIAYLGPAWALLAWKGRKHLALGVLIAAAVTLLLSGACVAVVFTSL